MQDTHMGRQEYPKELQGAEQPHSRESFGRAQPITGLQLFRFKVRWHQDDFRPTHCRIPNKVAERDHSFLAAAKLKHAQCCI